jgi:hypothetical protein
VTLKTGEVQRRKSRSKAANPIEENQKAPLPASPNAKRPGKNKKMAENANSFRLRFQK